MADVLERILETKRALVDQRRQRRPLAMLEAKLADAPAARGFARSLQARLEAHELALIAEIKKASPSRGLIRAGFDPQALARAYHDGGAACLSVLTDEPFFQGSDADLAAARGAVPLPVLRKDFTLDPYQVVEARLLGADCILLIMAALDDAAARDLARLAADLGMDVLLEVHDQAELERALRIDAPLLGINNRNLKTFEVDLATTERLAPLVPEGRVVVAESGLHHHRDLERLVLAGARCFLVGEALMRERDVAAATRTLLGHAEATA